MDKSIIYFALNLSMYKELNKKKQNAIKLKLQIK